jgi:hypothetical protein
MTGTRISWSNPKVLLTLLLVFLCGAASGALASKLAARQAAARYNLMRLENKKVVLERFKQELNLDSEQVEKIEIVLDDFMKYVHDLQVQMDETRVHGKEQILKILNDDQKKKFERLLAEAQGRPLLR